MFPVIALFPSHPLSSWGLLVSCAALSVLWLGRRNASARGLSAETVERLRPWLILGGFAGAHIYFLLAVRHWPFAPVSLAQLGDIFAGTAIQGGLWGGACAAAAYSRFKGLPLL